MIGAFSIIEKQRWHHSNIYSGAPMPWMNRITWSGTALHAGVVPGYPASHGCIRLPYSFAPKLFQMTTVGDNVIVSRSRPTPTLIEHPNLFQPLPPPAPPEMADGGPRHAPDLRVRHCRQRRGRRKPGDFGKGRNRRRRWTAKRKTAPEPAGGHSQADHASHGPGQHAVPDAASDPNRIHAITPDVSDDAKRMPSRIPAASAAGVDRGKGRHRMVPSPPPS